ncbi:MAG TPA: OmpA family protein [Chitinophagales bacterium]|nr:OmpA family protein [Chitinophagales bacterium]HNL84908.1 OmpA family protein [Chitinophagales bacterium]
MKSKSFKLTIENPCLENWEGMSSIENGRYCNTCKMKVIDFTNSTKSDIEKFFAQNRTGHCGRFKKSQLEQVYHYPNEDLIKRNKFKYAAAITFGLLTAKSASAQIKNENTEIIHIDQADSYLSKQLTTTKDSTNLTIRIKSAADLIVIPNCRLLIFSITKGYTFVAKTDSLGLYSCSVPLEDFPFQVYINANGFHIDSISIHDINSKNEILLNPIINEEILMGAPIHSNSFRDIYFDFAQISIRSEGEKTLKNILAFLKENTDVNLEINAYTDSRGSSKSNLNLSKQRAEEIKKWFTNKGINKKRIIAKGYGETEFVNDCKDGKECTEYEHQQNRRVEFRLIGKDIDINSVKRFDMKVSPYRK